jgi:transcriptional regulator with XRE-family HTH domain
MIRLREERLKRGWSQTELSARTRIASPDISAIERGVKQAFPGWRRKLAHALKRPEAYLFEEVGDEQ